MEVFAQWVKQSPFCSWGQTKGTNSSASAAKKSQDFTVCTSAWLNQFLQVCAAGTKVSHTPLLFPNQPNLKLKCGYSTVWVAGGRGAGTDSKTDILSGGGEA